MKAQLNGACFCELRGQILEVSFTGFPIFTIFPSDHIVGQSPELIICMNGILAAQRRFSTGVRPWRGIGVEG